MTDHTAERLLTADEFWEQYAGTDADVELMEGKVIPMPPSGGEASEIAMLLGIELGIYLRSHPLGRLTGADGGYRLSAETVRAPDVGFYIHDKTALITQPERHLPFAPDLAVEVVSPGDDAADLHAKIGLYLAAGTRLVWVLYPRQRQVVVHLPDGTASTLTDTDTLDGGAVLPGFTVAVSALFPPRPA